MGNYLGSLFHRLFGKESIRIVMFGLDAVGKTTILYRLKTGGVVSTIPSVGYNVETIQLENVQFCIRDVGGGDKIRPLWRHYFPGTHAIIFIIDSTDRDRIGEIKEDFLRVLAEDGVRDTEILVFANKQV